MSWRALRRWAPWLALVACGLLGGCATQTRELLERPPAGLPERAEIVAAPFFPQTDRLCGPAALATVLQPLGLPADPARLADEVFVPARGGSLQTELLAAVRRHGALATRLPGRLEALLREVAAGRPVVVLQNLGLSWAPAWHYAVVVGYDLPARELLLRSGAVRRERLPLRTFEFTWARSQSWAFAATLPGEWPLTADEGAVVSAALAFERGAPPAAARAAYAAALARWPDSLTLAMGLGNSHFAGGELPQAAEVFEAAARRHGSAAAWINLATTWLALQRPQAALQAAQAAAASGDPAWAAQTAEVLDEARRALGGR